LTVDYLVSDKTTITVSTWCVHLGFFGIPLGLKEGKNVWGRSIDWLIKWKTKEKKVVPRKKFEQ